MELINPKAGAFAAILAFAEQHFGSAARKEARAEAFREGFREGLKNLENEVDAIKQKVVGPDAEEAVVTAMRQALMSARYDKARGSAE